MSKPVGVRASVKQTKTCVAPLSRHARKKHGQNALPFCSSLYHHPLKRRLTPAENEWTAFLQNHSARGVFIGREDN
jgi:hypothetical protein